MGMPSEQPSYQEPHLRQWLRAFGSHKRLYQRGDQNPDRPLITSITKSM